MGKKMTPIDLGPIVVEGKRIVYGSKSVTGTATVALGSKLSSIDYVVVGLGTNPSLNAAWVSYSVSGTTLTLKVWKPTSSSDVTPIAATSAATVSYIAIGDPIG